MNPIREKHEEAMDLAEKAFLAKRQGDEKAYKDLTVQALKLEAEAAHAVRDDLGAEPTRSVLYRSAASLAFQAKKFREAEQLVTNGLAGNPPEEIADELRDLLLQIYRATGKLAVA